MRILAATALVALAACESACPKKVEDPAVVRGRQAYMGTCVACHNTNPMYDGPVGPAVKGASKELLASKVLKSEYPAGYKAKRDTKVMPPQPAMVGSIDDLAAFLNAP